jgi:hypothetical protein
MIDALNRRSGVHRHRWNHCFPLLQVHLTEHLNHPAINFNRSFTQMALDYAGSGELRVVDLTDGFEMRATRTLP